MELIRKTRTEITKNGNKIRYAIFKCLGCLQEVEKEISGGKRDKSCGCCKEKLISEKAKERFKNQENHPNFGKKFTKERRQKMSETRIENGLSKGKNNPNWQNGKSFEIYPQEFCKELKQQIYERDNYKCQCPDCNLENIKLMVHHIDYNKKNNNPDNLITLCNSCHSKTIGKNSRGYYIDYYQNVMINRTKNK